MNVKRISKRTLATLLSVLLLLSTIVVGTATNAGAAVSWSVGTSTYLIFDNSNTQWNRALWRLLVVTENSGTKTVYSYLSNYFLGGGSAQVSSNVNSKCFYKSLTSGTNKIKELSNIQFLTFVQVGDSSYLPEGSYNFSDIFESDNSIKSTNSYGIVSGNYTENYTSGFNDTTSGTNFVFTTSGDSPNYSVSMNKIGTNYSGLNIATGLVAEDGVSISYSGKTLGGISLSNNLSGTVLKNTNTSVSPTYSSTLVLTATPETGNGYSFIGWYDGNTLVSTDNPYNYNVYSGKL